jgi:hypothetical protein
LAVFDFLTKPDPKLKGEEAQVRIVIVSSTHNMRELEGNDRMTESTRTLTPPVQPINPVFDVISVSDFRDVLDCGLGTRFSAWYLGSI